MAVAELTLNLIMWYMRRGEGEGGREGEREKEREINQSDIHKCPKTDLYTIIHLLGSAERPCHSHSS